MSPMQRDYTYTCLNPVANQSSSMHGPAVMSSLRATKLVSLLMPKCITTPTSWKADRKTRLPVYHVIERKQDASADERIRVKACRMAWTVMH